MQKGDYKWRYNEATGELTIKVSRDAGFWEKRRIRQQAEREARQQAFRKNKTYVNKFKRVRFVTD